jgi:hypothetical protein
MATTVLDLVQSVLSSMDSDEINSVGDTIESQQIGQLVKEIYDDIVDQFDLPSTKTTFQLESQADPLQPTHMNIPEYVNSVEWVRYNTKNAVADADRYTPIAYLTPTQFMDLSNARSSTDSTVQTVSLDSLATIAITNNAAPQYWTSFDDIQIIFDSFNFNLETNLQTSKTTCYGQQKPILIIADATQIDLPTQLMGHLRNEVRSLAFDLYKDGTSPKVDQAARRSRVRTQRNKHKLRMNQERDSLNDYGRKAPRRGKRLGIGSTGAAKPLPDYF